MNNNANIIHFTNNESMTPFLQNLRNLDVDDLIVLSKMGEGWDGTRVAKYLNLTQPAVSQRLSKIQEVFQQKIYVKMGRHLVLTDVGKVVSRLATEALAALDNLTQEKCRE